MDHKMGLVAAELRQGWTTPTVAMKNAHSVTWGVICDAKISLLGYNVTFAQWTEHWSEILSEAIEAADALHL